jgi:hypothetical protein
LVTVSQTSTPFPRNCHSIATPFTVYPTSPGDVLLSFNCDVYQLTEDETNQCKLLFLVRLGPHINAGRGYPSNQCCLVRSRRSLFGIYAFPHKGRHISTKAEVNVVPCELRRASSTSGMDGKELVERKKLRRAKAPRSRTGCKTCR